SPSASSLCLIDYPERTNNAEYWMRATMDVDSQGDLYVPDIWNNRVLEYYQPFSSDKTGGKGDAIADKVWGQPNFTTNLKNNSSTFTQNTTPTAQTLDLGTGPVDYSTSRGVTVNPDGSIWVADTYNHRVLHFPANSSTADVVLGQPNFTSNSFTCNKTGTSLTQMCM